MPAAGKRPEERLVPAKNERPVLAQADRDLGFCLCDVLARTEKLDVRSADVGDDPVVRLGDPRELFDLAEVAHPHLEDGDLRLGAEAEHRHRKADVGIEIALGFADPEFLREDGGDHLLGRGLADAAGHGDRADAAALFVLGGKTGESAAGILRLQEGKVLAELLRRSGAAGGDHAARARENGGSGEIRSVIFFARDRDKDISLGDGAGIGADPREFDLFIVSVIHGRDADHGGKLGYADASHSQFSAHFDFSSFLRIFPLPRTGRSPSRKRGVSPRRRSRTFRVLSRPG